MILKWLMRLVGLFVVQVLVGAIAVSAVTLVANSDSQEPGSLPHVIGFLLLHFVLPASLAMTLPGAAAAELMALLMLREKPFSSWALAFTLVGAVLGVIGGMVLLMFIPAGAGPLESTAISLLLGGLSGLVSGFGATILWRFIHRVAP